ncbi:uncharacterized protein RJT21DRAFT_1813 [Scheffersomyces amazonensis]|uniref:uncharacterized protein n=1 Tax=Scheffersomyces amazonensis TaxID=1078765 RepID=UPI00315C6301
MLRGLLTPTNSRLLKPIVTTPVRLFSSTLKKMSQEYTVIIYDKPGTDRTKVRPIHLQDLVGTVNAGVVIAGGALFTDETKTKFVGSTLQIAANSKEEVIEALKQDVYYREGIWDIDSALIYPSGMAVRLPKKLAGTREELFN